MGRVYNTARLKKGTRSACLRGGGGLAVIEAREVGASRILAIDTTRRNSRRRKIRRDGLRQSEDFADEKSRRDCENGGPDVDFGALEM